MKFTEEQYQKIVDAWDAKKSYTETAESIVKMFIYDFKESWQFDIEQAFTLANPLTREWAHEQFVEKEKKYVWSSKKVDRDSNVLTLYIDKYGMVSTSYRKVYEKNLRNEDMFITESEIKEWGYNPEMFNKEEVE